jgi:hypothetical protein
LGSGCTLESDSPDSEIQQPLIRVSCDEDDPACCLSEFVAACAGVEIEEVPESDPAPLPDESSLAEGTTLCTCRATQVTFTTLATFAALDATMVDAEAVMPVPDPGMPNCDDGNAKLKEDLNEMRFEGSSTETRVTKIKGLSERNKATVEQLGVAIGNGKSAVDKFERLGYITKAKADELRAHLKTAEDKQKAAKTKLEASIKTADESIALVKDAQKLAQDGLDALKGCPPNVALARQNVRAAARKVIDGINKEEAAENDALAGAKTANEGRDSLMVVEAALKAALPPK